MHFVLGMLLLCMIHMHIIWIILILYMCISLNPYACEFILGQCKFMRLGDILLSPTTKNITFKLFFFLREYAYNACIPFLYMIFLSSFSSFLLFDYLLSSLLFFSQFLFLGVMGSQQNDSNITF